MTGTVTKIQTFKNSKTKIQKFKEQNSNLNFFGLPRDTKIAKIWKNKTNRTDLPKIKALCKEYLWESCFNKSADLRRLINSKD